MERNLSLPGGVQVWRGSDLGRHDALVQSSGWPALDQALPGGGWPCNALTEVLSAQAGVLEWRLAAPSLRTMVAAGKQIVLVGPPYVPHVPGLLHLGLTAQQLVWVQADSLPDRLWTCRQLFEANAAGALLVWLPQVRAEQVRRLQIAAQGFDGLVFVFRHESARQEASAAPLRVLARPAADWTLRLQILKRRGPLHMGELSLASVPGGLSAVLPPHRLGRAQPQRAVHGAPHVVAGIAAERVAVH